MTLGVESGNLRRWWWCGKGTSSLSDIFFNPRRISCCPTNAFHRENFDNSQMTVEADWKLDDLNFQMRTCETKKIFFIQTKTAKKTLLNLSRNSIYLSHNQ
ncbi:hypothetical protein NPIL_589421 [Nephila pilipes]|uniref:Uncharacterized protein n=1 Tax=Nephila pilipes TaxID=299642 RepID=A0A8X6PBT5_NEPPI|nr:hypothetical protein NPIL_589421 [Nephila pilipes]